MFIVYKEKRISNIKKKNNVNIFYKSAFLFSGYNIFLYNFYIYIIHLSQVLFNSIYKTCALIKQYVFEIFFYVIKYKKKHRFKNIYNDFYQESSNILKNENLITIFNNIYLLSQY